MFFQELKQFIKSILSWVYLFLIFSGFFFLFGLKEVEIWGRSFFLPLPTIHSFSVQLFKIMSRNLLPETVPLIVTNPLAAFLSQVKISLLLAFVFTFPVLLYKITIFFSPALYEKEKKAVLKLLVSSALLFASGCLFAYFLLIPLILKALYPYALLIGAVPFFSVSEFIGLVLGLMVASGIMFLLPVFMALLSRIGIIGPDFWLKNWRYAILVFLFTSAIITPDGSGISMTMLSLPLTGLYFAGTIIAMKYKPSVY